MIKYVLILCCIIQSCYTDKVIYEDNIDFKSLTRKTSRMLLPSNENTIEVSILLFTIIRNPFDLLASYWAHDNFFGWEVCKY